MKIIVIGGTAAGLSAASKVKREHPDWEVTVYERSTYTSYGSCGLPYFIKGIIEKPEDLVNLTVKDLEEERGIKTFIRHDVVKLDHENKFILVKNLDTGEEFEDSYDEIVLATGASPFTIAAATPPQPGYPQPPQFAPGSTSSILASLSSTSTANFCAAKANTAPNINPMIPNNITAFNISTILHPLFL